jgi:hypothetical protein
MSSSCALTKFANKYMHLEQLLQKRTELQLPVDLKNRVPTLGAKRKKALAKYTRVDQWVWATDAAG